MDKISELIEAEKLFLEGEQNLIGLSSKIIELESQLTDLRQEYEQLIKPHRDRLVQAQLRQARTLDVWVCASDTSIQKYWYIKRLYHQRYLFGKTREWYHPKAWLRMMVYGDIRKPTLDLECPDGKRSRVVLSGNSLQEYFEEADQILTKAGWNLIDYSGDK